MANDIKVPHFPESISEGTISVWHKKAGDVVEQDEVILEVETDKVVMEVPAPESGVLSLIHKDEGDTVISEEVVGQVDTENKVMPVKENTGVEISSKNSSGISLDVSSPSFPESISEGTLSTWHKQVGETVIEGDILLEVETDKVMMEVPATTSGTLVEHCKEEGDTILSNEVVARISQGAVSIPENNIEVDAMNVNDSLSPSVRRAAKVNGVDVADVTGTGKRGRVTKNDIQGHADKKPSKISTAPLNIEESCISGRTEKRVKMTRLRQTIAKRLLEVQQSNALLTTFNEVDMKPVMEMRKKYKDLFQKTHDTKLGFMSFFIKAATEALKRFPDVNASIDGQDVVYHGFFDIGVAVGTDRGLVVPVIRDTDHKSFSEVESTIVDKALKARDGKLSLEEMQGGTFTITNGGTYGSMLSTPIVNAPQSAILGMHNIVERPVVQNGEIVIRPIMYLALSYDHRIIDGGTSVRFLKTIKELIEDPARILLQL
jgi:2-oxoglutarate dehydrogenase E2 component (dihydrolipoamide succinyltransferase)